MRVICVHENLKRGLAATSRISGGSTSLPVLGSILLKTDNGLLKMSTTNLEIAVNTWIRCKVEEEGAIAVPAKTFLDLVSNLPNQNAMLSVKDLYLTIESGTYKTKIKGLSADDFPLVPEVLQDGGVTLPVKELKTAISQVSFAAAYSETQPEISGVLFAFGEGNLKIVATDRYRLAEKKIEVEHGGENRSFIVPGRAVQELAKLLSNPDAETVSVFVSQNQVMFKAGDTELTSRLIDGQYPDYVQIIPRSSTTEAVVDVGALTAAVRAAGIFTSTGNNITMEIAEPDQLAVTSASGDLGESRVDVPVSVKGAAAKVILNHRYVLDCLSAIGASHVSFRLSGDSAPVLITSPEVSGYVYVVMPIKI